jgi:L-threonylcarbamoyladenylate synthase
MLKVSDLGLRVPGRAKRLDKWCLPELSVTDRQALQSAAELLQQSDIPVAFPTETVYGLGADATRSSAVRSIYAAKGRPSDNPLIIHVSDLAMLRQILQPSTHANGNGGASADEKQGQAAEEQKDPIPSIYHPLIDRFWPGPLTILLPNPSPSALAPEVSAGLSTFGARLPSAPLARSLIHLTGKPLAAPSANASTRPSPTTAQHVADDLSGRIALILDGGPCQVGVESTVVDGLSNPPVILRPGGVSLQDLRQCQGWEDVQKAYKDGAEIGKSAPRAPGMKYKHYSPKARVVLFEASAGQVDLQKAVEDASSSNDLGLPDGTENTATRLNTIGVIRTARWRRPSEMRQREKLLAGENGHRDARKHGLGFDDGVEVEQAILSDSDTAGGSAIKVLDVHLGPDTRQVAHLLFSALRELDRLGANVILIEGFPDADDIAAAVMNRLRKAASEVRA